MPAHNQRTSRAVVVGIRCHERDRQPAASDAPAVARAAGGMDNAARVVVVRRAYPARCATSRCHPRARPRASDTIVARLVMTDRGIVAPTTSPYVQPQYS